MKCTVLLSRKEHFCWGGGEKKRRRRRSNRGKVQQTNKQTSKENHPTTRLPHPWFFHPPTPKQQTPLKSQSISFLSPWKLLSFSLFNNFISCFRKEEVLLSLFPVFYFCSILFPPFIRFSRNSVSFITPSHLSPSRLIPLRLKVNVISECRSLEGQNSKSFSPTSVFQLKLTFEQQNSSEKSKRFQQTGNFFCCLHTVKVFSAHSGIRKWNYAS